MRWGPIRRAVIASGVLLFALTLGSVAAAEAEPVDIQVTANETLEAGETDSATVSARGANAGVGAYELTLAVDDPTVGTLENISLAGAGTPLVETEWAYDGSSVTVAAALLDQGHDPADDIDLFDVGVAGHEEGTLEIEVESVREVATLEADQYAIDSTGETTVAVEGDTGTAGPSEPPSPAALTVSAIDYPETAVAGETRTLATTVENTGEQQGTATHEVMKANETVETTQVTVPAGAEEVVETSLTLPSAAESVPVVITLDGEPTEREILTESQDETNTTAVADDGVPEDHNETGSGDGETDDNTAESMPGFGILAGLVGLGVACYRLRNRR